MALTAFVETAFASNLGTDWQDRLKKGAYKSPKGTRIEFDCFAVERRMQLRGTMFEFDGVNEGYIQRKGFGSRQYPLVCVFSGDTHDLQATAFEDALTENGFGTLTHPMYGEFKVIPFGEVGRNNSLTEKVNQSIVEVVFWTSTVTPYPTDQINFANELSEAIKGFDVVAAQSFSKKTNLLTEARRANVKSTYRKFLRDTSAVYREVSDELSGVRREIADAQALVNETIDVLIGQPIALAQQALGIARAPARALSGIESRLAGYQQVVRDMFASALALPSQTLAAGANLTSRQIKISNDLHTADLFVTAAVVGAAASTLEYTFGSKKEALQSADDIVQMFEDTATWRDAQFEAMEVNQLSEQQVDTGESWQAFQRVVAINTGRLVEISFSLFPERYVILERARTVLDLCAELYGRVDESTIDSFITSNNFTGSEILEIPSGRRVTYYRAA